MEVYLCIIRIKLKPWMSMSMMFMLSAVMSITPLPLLVRNSYTRCIVVYVEWRYHFTEIKHICTRIISWFDVVFRRYYFKIIISEKVKMPQRWTSIVNCFTKNKQIHGFYLDFLTMLTKKVLHNSIYIHTKNIWKKIIVLVRCDRKGNFRIEVLPDLP